MLIINLSREDVWVVHGIPSKRFIVSPNSKTDIPYTVRYAVISKHANYISLNEGERHHIISKNEKIHTIHSFREAERIAKQAVAYSPYIYINKQSGKQVSQFAEHSNYDDKFNVYYDIPKSCWYDLRCEFPSVIEELTK